MELQAFKGLVTDFEARVTRLNRISRRISGTQGVLRQPRIDDVVEIDSIERRGDTVVVTASLVEDGKLLFRAEFEPDELTHEPMNPAEWGQA